MRASPFYRASGRCSGKCGLGDARRQPSWGKCDHVCLAEHGHPGPHAFIATCFASGGVPGSAIQVPVAALSQALVVGLCLALTFWALPLGTSYTPAPIGAPLEPTPELDGMATFNVHQSGWPALAYQLASGAQPSLPAVVRSTATGSIFLTPADVQSSALQGDVAGGSSWSSVASWSMFAGAGGATATGPTAVTINGQTAIQSSLNTSAATQQPGVGLRFAWWIPSTNYPSLNTLFDWVTVAYSLSGPACPVAGQCYATPFLTNLSSSSLFSTGLYVYPNGQERQYYSNPGDGSAPFNVHEGHSGWATFSIGALSSGAGGFNATGKDSAPQVYFSLEIFLPPGASTRYTLTVYALALTNSALFLGPSSWGSSSYQRDTFQDAINLTSLSPTFSYSAIVAGGYRVAVAERAQDLATGQTTVAYFSTAKVGFVEEATYTFDFGFPSDPSLSYSTMNLTDSPAVPISQYVNVAYNGSGLLGIYAGFTVGVRSFVLSVPVATSTGIWVATIDYTAQQWGQIQSGGGGVASSLASSLLTFFGNYWWVFAVALAATVIILAAASEDRRGRRHPRG